MGGHAVFSRSPAVLLVRQEACIKKSKEKACGRGCKREEALAVSGHTAVRAPARAAERGPGRSPPVSGGVSSGGDG